MTVIFIQDTECLFWWFSGLPYLYWFLFHILDCLLNFIHLFAFPLSLFVYSRSFWGQILAIVFPLSGHLWFSGIHYLIALTQHRCSFYIAYRVLLYSFRIPSQSNKTRTRCKRVSNREGRSKTIPICRWHDLYLRDPPKNILPKKLLGIINSFSKVAGYKINIQKSVAFLYTNNAQIEKEIRETIPFTIASKNKVPRNTFNKRNQRPF
jgi:hypothetical protein